jgi:hypothetical protein
MLSAVMEDSNMHGVFNDMIETFSDTVINNVHNAANQGYFMTVLREDVTLHVISENDVLSTTSSFDFVSMEFVRVEYRDKLTSQAIDSIVISADDVLSNDSHAVTSFEIGVFSVVGCLAVLIALFGVKSYSKKSNHSFEPLDNTERNIHNIDVSTSGHSLFDCTSTGDVNVNSSENINTVKKVIVRRK